MWREIPVLRGGGFELLSSSRVVGVVVEQDVAAGLV